VILTKVYQTTTTYDSDSSEEDNGDEDASDNSEDDEITHISKKKLRDMVLAQNQQGYWLGYCGREFSESDHWTGWMA
jgi:hypothetical protein